LFVIPDVMHRRAALLCGAAAFACCLAAAGARAQLPPSAQEIAAYRGLHAAAARGDVALAAKLIAGGAAVDARDGYRRTPLHVATYARQREIVALLARSGADLDAQERDRYDAVTIAAVADDVETLRLLLKLGASAKALTSRYDGTALIAAAHLGHDEVVRVLIAAGAPLDHVNNLGWTALIESIVLGQGGPRHVETLRALVRAGANVNLPDRNGRTPLALARGRGYAEMVRILEAAGAR
jgi:ankyrin repeat protein